MIRSSAVYGILAALGISLVGCAGNYVPIAPAVQENAEKLGPAQGTACGSIGVGDPPLYFIPIMINSRAARAYKRAVASVPGATALVNPTLEEHWFWWVLMTTRCTTIRGEAVR